MAKSKINVSEHQSLSHNLENVEKVTKNPKAELIRTFTRHAWPREVIEHAKYKLYPIESGVVKFFNRTKGEWFITPDDQMKKDIRVRDYEKVFIDGESVNYIEINNEALVADKWVVKFKSTWGDIKMLFVTPDNWSQDVVLTMKPYYPHNKVEWNANMADKSRLEYTIDFKDFDDRDEVNFVANKKGNIIAIQKIEK